MSIGGAILRILVQGPAIAAKSLLAQPATMARICGGSVPDVSTLQGRALVDIGARSPSGCAQGLPPCLLQRRPGRERRASAA